MSILPEGARLFLLHKQRSPIGYALIVVSLFLLLTPYDQLILFLFGESTLSRRVDTFLRWRQTLKDANFSFAPSEAVTAFDFVLHYVAKPCRLEILAEQIIASFGRARNSDTRSSIYLITRLITLELVTVC